MSHPAMRPRKQAPLIWLWVTAPVLVAAVAFLLLDPLGIREVGERPVQEPATNDLEQREATEEAAPEAEEQPMVVPAPRDEPRVRPTVRASIYFVDEEGPERRVTLDGCGFASGLLVGERAPVGNTGIDLEITRLRDDSRCTARTDATAAQLHAITEVVFRARTPDDRAGD